MHDMHHATALAMDPEFGILDGSSTLPPDFLNRNPTLFKSKSMPDPDTPNFKDVLTGPFRDEFIEGMVLEIQELEGHGTWTIMNHSDINETAREDGTMYIPDVIPSTWAFKVKKLPSGVLKKIKSRFCVRGDLQTEGVNNVFDTYAPVAHWSSIRMLTVLALQQDWVTKQIDFSNAFVQAPLDKDVYVSMPALFDDSSKIDPKTLCIKLHKSPNGMKKAPNS